jgi:hypothetical protein
VPRPSASSPWQQPPRQRRPPWQTQHDAHITELHPFSSRCKQRWRKRGQRGPCPHKSCEHAAEAGTEHSGGRSSGGGPRASDCKRQSVLCPALANQGGRPRVVPWPAERAQGDHVSSSHGSNAQSRAGWYLGRVWHPGQSVAGCGCRKGGHRLYVRRSCEHRWRVPAQ